MRQLLKYKSPLHEMTQTTPLCSGTIPLRFKN